MHSSRIIYHLDMDAFFASAELIRHPQLIGKPLIIGGSVQERGVVSTCSYEARKFGVHSAMSMGEALQRCPQAVVLPVDHTFYKTLSQKVMAIINNFCPYTQIVSIDEAYLDMSSVVKHVEIAIPTAQAIKQSIFKATSLTCSIGIASNKLVAKIISSTHKPNGLECVLPGNEASFLSPLPIDVIPGIGTKTQERLKKKGYIHIVDIQNAGVDKMMDAFGLRGYQYYQLAMGKHYNKVEWQKRPPKSISKETTFTNDIRDISTLKKVTNELADKAIDKLLINRMRTRSVGIKIRDTSFHTVTRTTTFPQHTNDCKRIKASLESLLLKSYYAGTSIRLLGVSLEHLTNGYWQPTFWDD